MTPEDELQANTRHIIEVSADYERATRRGNHGLALVLGATLTVLLDQGDAIRARMNEAEIGSLDAHGLTYLQRSAP